MADRPDFKTGDIVRRNRRVCRVQRVTRDHVHIRVLKDTQFQIYEGEILPLDQAPSLLRHVPRGHYSTVLFESPDKIESLVEKDAAALMRLVLEEHDSAFGKREFRQILVLDDAVVEADRWNAFWTQAYKAMRADDAFAVDEKGRYSLA